MYVPSLGSVTVPPVGLLNGKQVVNETEQLKPKADATTVVSGATSMRPVEKEEDVIVILTLRPAVPEKV